MVVTQDRRLTIHEAQGLTFEHVVCVRTNPKPLLLYDRII